MAIKWIRNWLFNGISIDFYGPKLVLLLRERVVSSKKWSFGGGDWW